MLVVYMELKSGGINMHKYITITDKKYDYFFEEIIFLVENKVLEIQKTMNDDIYTFVYRFDESYIINLFQDMGKIFEHVICFLKRTGNPSIYDFKVFFSEFKYSGFIDGI